MVKIGVPSGAKQIFDFDIIAGLVLAIIVDYVMGYIALNVYTPLTQRFLASGDFTGFAYDDILVMVILAVGAIVMKGRTRKIFIYAFWFEIFYRLMVKVLLSGQAPWA